MDIKSFLSKIFFTFTCKKVPFACKGKGIKVIGYPYYCWNPNVRLGNNVQLYPGVTFAGCGEIIIGNNVKIGNNVVINASKSGGVSIGDGTIIAANTYIIDSNHGIKRGLPVFSQSVDGEYLYIGKNVWIAANCVIAKGSFIGDDAVIGAGSFLNSKVKENQVFAGTPAKLIKERI